MERNQIPYFSVASSPPIILSLDNGDKPIPMIMLTLLIINTLHL